jgi:heat shock protein HslJ
MRIAWLLAFGVFACGGAHEEGGLDLAGRDFVSESLQGRTLLAGTAVHLRFRSSELSAGAGCNSMSGPYSFDGDKLVMNSMATTEIGCEAPLAAQDDWLAGFLRARPTAELVEPRLTLSTSSEILTLLDREIASPDRTLVGTRWIGAGIGDGVGVSFGPNSTLLTVAFDSDGTVETFSGCQHGSGGFVADGATLSFTDLTHDGVACENSGLERQSESFLFVLDGSNVTFEIEEAELTIERAGTTLYFMAEN